MLWDAYVNPMLWTLQGWLAMFFIAAAYAKLTESRETLVFMMQWPAWTTQTTVMAVGWAEFILALGVLAPLVSWPLGRPVMLVSSALLTLNAFLMLTFYAAEANVFLAVVNLALILIGLGVVVGRRRWKPRGPGPS